MCKNHQHLVASTVIGSEMPNGDVVYIVVNKIDSVMIQSSHGAALQVPCSMTLLLPLHPRGTVFSSPEALMAGLAALLSVEEMIEIEDGAEPEMRLIASSVNSLTLIQGGAD